MNMKKLKKEHRKIYTSKTKEGLVKAEDYISLRKWIGSAPKKAKEAFVGKAFRLGMSL